MLARVFSFYSDDSTKRLHLAVAGTNSTNASADNIGPISGVTVPTGGGLTVISAGKTNDFNGQGSLANWTQAALTERTTGNDAGMSLLYRLATPAGATGDLTVSDNGGTNSLGLGFGKLLCFIEVDATGSGSLTLTLATTGAGAQPSFPGGVVARGLRRPVPRRHAPPRRAVRGRFLGRSVLPGGAAPPAETTGSGSLTLTLAITAAGTQAQSGTGGIGLTLGASGSGQQAQGGAGAITLTLSTAGGGTQAVGGTGGLALTLATSGSGQQAQLGAGALVLTLAVTSAGLQAQSAAGGLALTLGITATGGATTETSLPLVGRGLRRPVRVPKRPPSHQLIGGPQRFARRDIPELTGPTGAGGFALTLAVDAVGTQRGTGAGALALTLEVDGAGQQRQTAGGGLALTLAMDAAGTQALAGSGGLTLTIAVAATGRQAQSGAGAITLTLRLAGTDQAERSGLLCPDLALSPRRTPAVTLDTLAVGVTTAPRLAPRITLRSRCS
jgi:hypothetical protein